MTGPPYVSATEFEIPEIRIRMWMMCGVCVWERALTLFTHLIYSHPSNKSKLNTPLKYHLVEQREREIEMVRAAASPLWMVANATNTLNCNSIVKGCVHRIKRCDARAAKDDECDDKRENEMEGEWGRAREKREWKKVERTESNP